MPIIPAWNALHPLVVHFPIALLTVAPVLVAAGLLAPRLRGLLPAAFLLMVLGTGAAWLAVASGETAGQLAERLPGVGALLERHEELAEATRTAFTILTLAFGALLALPRVLRREPPRAVRAGGYGVLLAGCAVALALLLQTAHHGGRLVHEKGVHAMIGGPGATAASIASQGPRERHHHDDD